MSMWSASAPITSAAAAPSELIQLPDSVDRAANPRRAAALVEVLADHDDALLEKVVEDIKPTPDEVFERLRAGGSARPM